jgi:hypothetical protein
LEALNVANTSRINGFKPVKHLNGSPYNGQANIYEVPAGEAVPVFVGDLVILSNSAGTAGVPAVETACAASSQAVSVAVVGAVVGIINTKLDPLDGKMTSGSILILQSTVLQVPSNLFLLRIVLI